MTDEITSYEPSIEYSKKFTSPATDVVVAAAPTGSIAPASAQLIVDFLMVNGDDDGSLQLQDSDGNAIDGYFWQWLGGGGLLFDRLYLEGVPSGKGLKLSTLGGGNHAVIIKYHWKSGGAL